MYNFILLAQREISPSHREQMRKGDAELEKFTNGFCVVFKTLVDINHATRATSFTTWIEPRLLAMTDHH